MSLLTRRTFLAQASQMAALPWLAARLAARSPARESRALILLWLDGGCSHLDTFDPKRAAPSEVRGPFDAVESAIEGVELCARLPRLATLLDRAVLLRGISSGEGNHDRAAAFLLTGHRPAATLTSPGWPCWLTDEGAFDPRSPLPSYVALPAAPLGARAGYLPASRGPIEMALDLAHSRLSLPNVEPRPGTAASIALAAQLDALDGAPRSRAELARDRFRAQALAISQSREAREALDLELEPADLRARYGAHLAGQGLLAARRLVERGTRAVLVHWDGWDHHREIGEALGYGFPPRLDALDQSVSALHEDLERRGLLERVVVAVATEFGRTPRLNLQGGRDHWPRASCALLFGAGLRRGVVHGATDARGEEPLDEGIAPPRVGATILAALGLDPAQEIQAPNGRPIPLIEKGQAPIREVLA
ncbi:MAG: DUF1501 domain-containing protein [Planctomycetes bacterium]|nr:DUF1501 domain-containing protein [Planctomycetota bacterium]